MKTTEIEMKKRSPTSANTTLDILEETTLRQEEGKVKNYLESTQ